MKKLLPRLIKMLACLLFGFGLCALTITVQGTVSGDGSPLAEVSIFEKGTTNGVALDFDGNVRYGTQEVHANGQTAISVSLFMGSKLDEIIAVAYGSQKKKDIAGLVPSVRVSELKSIVVINPTTILQVKPASVYELFLLPSEELARNPNLKQNPCC